MSDRRRGHVPPVRSEPAPARRRGADAQRTIEVSYETVHQWTRRFGPAYAAALRRRRPKPGDKWRLDETFVKIQGQRRYLWRGVDAQGNVLDILVQNRRDKAAARCFFRRLTTLGVRKDVP